MARKYDHGKAFEKEVHDAFRSLYLKHPIRWDRIVDSHDAGNIVKSTDSDFKLTIASSKPGYPLVFCIECKASIDFDSLADNGARRSLIRAPQLARMRLAMRAGMTGLYFFKSMGTGYIEVWDAHRVVDAWAKKRYHWVAQPDIRIMSDDLKKWAEHWVKEQLDWAMAIPRIAP